MSFVIQQPGESGLLATLNKAAVGARAGGGVFAFASEAGIKNLFSQPNIQALLRAHESLRFVVGVDAITNADALLYLSKCASEFDFSAYVFIHNHSGTFHPKFSWFDVDGDLRLITGSGNLTLSGLGHATASLPGFGNWEAFTLQTLTGKAAARTRQVIDDWFKTQLHSRSLRLLDDPEVRKRAMENGRLRFERSTRPSKGTGKRAHAQPQPTPIDGAPAGGKEVLLRELSKNRPGQADVGKEVLEFFGFSALRAKDTSAGSQGALVQWISLDNEVGEPAELNPFVNKSRNFRLELPATKHVEYKDSNDNRMILIAVKLSPRSFRYAVVPVDHPTYRELVKNLGPMPKKRGRSRAMREKFMSSDELREKWPSAPQELLPISLPMTES